MFEPIDVCGPPGRILPRDGWVIVHEVMRIYAGCASPLSGPIRVPDAVVAATRDTHKGTHSERIPQ